MTAYQSSMASIYEKNIFPAHSFLIHPFFLLYGMRIFAAVRDVHAVYKDYKFIDSGMDVRLI